MAPRDQPLERPPAGCSARAEVAGDALCPFDGRSRDQQSAPTLTVVKRHPSEHEIMGGDGLPLIPPGRYEAFGGKATKPYQPFGPRGPWKITVTWYVRVPEERGDRFVELLRHYNVIVGRDGRLRAGKSSAYRREWVVAAGRRPSRHDRLSPLVFNKIACSVDVETVTHDSAQRPLSPLNHYSKIARIIERTAGGATC